MADDLSKRGPADALRVNVNEPWELKYWTAHFRVTEEELRSAVRAAGVMAKDVGVHILAKRLQSKPI